MNCPTLTLTLTSAMSLDSMDMNMDRTTSRTKTLPPRLQETMSKGSLAQPRPGLYILGTVHIGSESAEEAQALIEAVKPLTVVIEIPPSRLKRIRLDNHNDNNKNAASLSESKTLTPTSSTISALRSLPALAAVGWTKGGLSGLIFSTLIVGSSLLKKSTTVNEEENTLPRRNEFTAAIEAADNVGSTVIPADWEFEELIGAVTRSVSPLGWVNLGMHVMSEAAGLRPVDPIWRLRDETMVEWALRRRNIATSRASKAHGEGTAPGLSRVLVDNRDARFADICLEVLHDNAATESIKDANYEDGQGASVVCIVGLVHLDGVVERLRNYKQKGGGRWEPQNDTG